MARPFFTIGHSTRPLDEFVGLLKQRDVTLIVDVRKMPGSRSNPQYSAPEFAQALQDFRIGYRHIAELGGLRKKSRDIDSQVNGFWTNRSFHNYADYAESTEFQSGLATLRDLGHKATCAIMCAEAPWWRCHRRIIADHLIAAGESVFHIMSPGRVEPARLTEGAEIGADGRLTYPAPSA
ncbi:MAG: DUF488 family protein [Pseudomonadota bacterium]